MRTKISLCGLVLASSVLALAGLPARADAKKDNKGKPALSGSWIKKEGELKIEFAGKGVLMVAPHGNEKVLLVRCTYTVRKGVVQVKITGFDGKAEAKGKVKEILPVGTAFRFQWKAKGDTAKLDGLKGDKAEHLKTHLEGEYKQKK
jgi:hypothetical protein